jgi:hypothetical protein
MKKAALLIVSLFLLNCAHRSAVVPPVYDGPAYYQFTVPSVSLPPVTDEAPSPLLVVEPMPVSDLSPREPAGRFLQRIAYHTAVREGMTKTPVQRVAGVVEETPAPPHVASQSLPSTHVCHDAPIRKIERAVKKSIDFTLVLMCFGIVVFGVFFERSNM